MIVLSKMDADNIDFSALVDSIRELWGNRCVLLNVPVGQGHGLRRASSARSTFRPRLAGAVVDPGEIHESLIESIIEVDEAVMEKYLEGTPPTAEELAPADGAGRRARAR